MIVVSIDLWPHGEPPRHERDHLARLVIWNDRSGSATSGNYEARLIRAGAPTHPNDQRAEDIIAETYVSGFGRDPDQTHVADLVAQVLDDMRPIVLPGLA